MHVTAVAIVIVAVLLNCLPMMRLGQIAFWGAHLSIWRLLGGAFWFVLLVAVFGGVAYLTAFAAGLFDGRSKNEHLVYAALLGVATAGASRVDFSAPPQNASFAPTSRKSALTLLYTSTAGTLDGWCRDTLQESLSTKGAPFLMQWAWNAPRTPSTAKADQANLRKNITLMQSTDPSKSEEGRGEVVNYIVTHMLATYSLRQHREP